MAKTTNKIQYIAPIAIPPGETLLEFLEEYSMTQVELAKRINRPLKIINEIVKGKNAITPETSLQLESVFGMPATFWNNLETNFQDTKARLKNKVRLEYDIKIAKLYPYNELMKWKWVPETKNMTERVANLLSFFGVTSFQNIIENGLLKPISYRISPKKNISLPAVAAWLRKGVIDAQKIETEEFSRSKLQKSLGYIRKFINENTTTSIPMLKKIFSECGVAFVITPNLKNAPINGASRWLAPNKALMQLSIRNKFADIFWFSVFHEINHILIQSKKTINVDLEEHVLIQKKGQEEAEIKADRFASNVLMPQNLYRTFIEEKDFSSDSIEKFAKKIKTHPGIVIGRLQHDKHISFNALNRQREKYAWSEN